MARVRGGHGEGAANEGGKRLAVLLPSLDGGGAERVAIELIEQWLRDGHSIDLVLMRREGALLPLVPKAVQLIDLKAIRIRDALLPLIGYLRRRRPAALQASMWPLTVVAVVARALARVKTRLVLSDHSTLSKEYSGLSAFRTRIFRSAIAWAYPRADGRIVVSNRAADDLAQLSGIDRNSIIVIHSPVRQAPKGQRRGGRKSGDARILTVGRLSPEKNHALLIRAFAILNRTRPARLTILGIGSEKEALQQLALSEGVADRVTFAGFAIDPFPYYADADLFVLSSDFEGFGLVLVEAMSCGVPVVSTDCESGPREILADGQFGRLVPCGDADALARAMADTLDAPTDGKALKARAAELSGSDAADRYLALMLGREWSPKRQADKQRSTQRSGG